MCNFTTTYHTTCKHYSAKKYVYCPLAQSSNSSATNSKQSCHNTTDLGLETDFATACIKCQRIQARALFFGNSAPEPQPISYGIVASRGQGVPSVLVTSWVDTTHTASSSSTSSVSGSGSSMTRSDSSMSLSSLASETSVSSSVISQGSYKGWSFKEGKFGNAHWRSYQDDDEAAVLLARQKAKARIALKSSQEDYA